MFPCGYIEPMAEDAGSIFAEVRLRLDKLDVDIKKAQGSIDEFGKKIDMTTSDSAKKSKTNFDAMGLAATLGAAAIVAAFRSAVKGFSEYDTALTDVKAATRATASELAALEQAAKDAGKTTAFSAKEALKGIEALSKAGVSNADIMGGALTGALSLAAAGSIEVGFAAETAAAAMTQFGLSGQDATHIADLLSAAAGKSQGEVSDYAQALNQVGLVAAQTGLTIEETTAALAAFGAAGLKGSDAGTSFKTMLLALNGTSDESKALMSELGISAFNASGEFVGLEKFAGNLQDALKDMSSQQRNSTLQTIFGTDAIRAANVLYNQGAAGIAKWGDKVNDAGFAAETARIKNESLEGHFKKLSSAAENASNSFVEKLSPALKGVADIGATVLNFISGVPGPIQGAVAAFVLLSGGLLAAALAARGLGLALSASLGPIGLAVAGILAIGTGIAVAAAAADELEKKRVATMFKEISDETKLSGKALDDFKDKLKNADIQLSRIFDRAKGDQLLKTKEQFEQLAKGLGLTNDQLAQVILNNDKTTDSQKNLARSFVDLVAQSERLLAVRVRDGEQLQTNKQAELDFMAAEKERAARKEAETSSLSRAVSFQNDLIAKGIITEEEGLNNKIKLRQEEIDKIIEIGEKSKGLNAGQIAEIKRLQGLNKENADTIVALQGKISNANEGFSNSSLEIQLAYEDQTEVGKEAYQEIKQAVIESLDNQIQAERDAARERLGLQAEGVAGATVAAAAYVKYDKLRSESSVTTDADIDKSNKERTEKELNRIKMGVDAWKGYVSSVSQLFQGLISALADLFAADIQNQQNALDEQYNAQVLAIDARLKAELEANGLAEKSDVEKAQAQIETAISAGDVIAEAEARRALLKAQIEKKANDDRIAADEAYQKKKAQLEYQANLASWEAKVAGAIAQVPVTILNAISAGWVFGPIGAAIFGGLASAAAGIQLAAVISAKPNPPKMATGGIILPQSGGVPVVAAENGSPELMLNSGDSGQALLSQFAALISDRIGGGGNIVLQMVVDGRMIAETTAPYFEKGIVRLKL